MTTITPGLAQVSEAEATAGTGIVPRAWSPERVAQSIAALAPAGHAAFQAGQTWSFAHNALTLATLEITTGTYAGGWRYTGAGGLNWYFVLAAMVLTSQFSEVQMRAAVETCLDTSVVGPWEASATYAAGTKVVIDGKVFFVNIGGTTGGTQPDVSGAANSGDFVGDGTITWEYMGTTIPTEWKWVVIDVLNDLSTLDYPDSHDAYAGMLAAAALKAGVDATWLAAASAFPGKTRLALIGQVFSACVTDTIDGTGLASTFQGEKLGDGTPYPIRFIADNTDAWRGAKALADLYAIAGDGANETAADALAGTLKNGIKALWDATAGRFRTYQGQTGYANLTGDAAFVTNLRFHAWPILHGMWTDYTEWTTYADPVIAYSIINTPGLWDGELDEFALTEWFFMAATRLGLPVAYDVLANRVSTRVLAKVSIIDIALRLEAMS